MEVGCRRDIRDSEGSSTAEGSNKKWKGEQKLIVGERPKSEDDIRRLPSSPLPSSPKRATTPSYPDAESESNGDEAKFLEAFSAHVENLKPKEQNKYLWKGANDKERDLCRFAWVLEKLDKNRVCTARC